MTSMNLDLWMCIDIMDCRLHQSLKSRVWYWFALVVCSQMTYQSLAYLVISRAGPFCTSNSCLYVYQHSFPFPSVCLMLSGFWMGETLLDEPLQCPCIASSDHYMSAFHFLTWRTWSVWVVCLHPCGQRARTISAGSWLSQLRCMWCLLVWMHY